MPIVEVNGQELEFPDSMDQAAIKAVLQKKFPKILSQEKIREGFSIGDIPQNKAEQDAAKAMDASILARTGRIGISAITAPSDLIYAAGTAPYNAIRGIQQAMGSDVAPPITMQSPGDYTRGVYDKYTNNVGKSEGMAKIADTAAEYLASGGGLGKAIPGMASNTVSDLAANAAAGAGSEYTKQQISDSPVAQMMAGIVSALAAKSFSGGAAKAIEKTTPIAQAEEKVVQRLNDSNVSPVSLKPGKPLVDIGGKNVERLGEAVANIPGQSADIAEKFVADRIANAGKNIKTTISDYISAGGDSNEMADAIMKAGRAKAAPKYKATYNVAIIPDKALKEIMQRPSMVQAAKNAEKIAADEGKDLSTLVTKTEFYDYVKRGLDDILEGYRDKTTGRLVLDTQGRAIEGLRKNYVDMIKQRNPLYKDALKESSTYFESKNALQNGADFLEKTPIQLRNTMNNLNKTDKELFKLGVANKLRDVVDSTNIGTDLGKKVFGKQETRDALRAVLEPKEYGQFKRSIEQQMESHKLNQKLLGNSRTILRKHEIDDLMQDPSDLINMSTNPTKFGMAKIAEFVSNKYQGLNRETSKEIAKMLFETHPQKQKDILYRLQKRASNGNKAALRGVVLWNKIGNTTKNAAVLNTINQGE